MHQNYGPLRLNNINPSDSRQDNFNRQLWLMIEATRKQV